MGFIFYLLLLLETPLHYAIAIIKSPMRIVCLFKDHYWMWYGGGWIFTAKYPAVCKRCGKFSKGDFDSMEKNKVGQLHIR